jgi:hypothetical protein
MWTTRNNSRDCSPQDSLAKPESGACRWHCVAATLACMLLVGCGSGGSKPMWGSVTCGNEKVSLGKVSFIPVEDTRGPVRGASIVDGQYRVDSQGGVPLGKYRVEVNARKKTGRKVQGSNGREVTMIDEEVRLGPEGYAGAKSPLIVEITSDFDGRYDIVIPGQ